MSRIICLKSLKPKFRSQKPWASSNPFLHLYLLNMIFHYNCRAICNLTRADNFAGLRREIAPPVIERLKRTYAHVDDVDLFTGKIQ